MLPEKSSSNLVGETKKAVVELVLTKVIKIQ